MSDKSSNHVSFCSAHQEPRHGCPLCYPDQNVPQLNEQYAAAIKAGWCPVSAGQNGEHKAGCQDGSEVL